ncbi:hypothetical protein [Legionella cincinnatiensis]|uniref:Dot/Icm secretion system substrate n=1 Tax=Legionella cincinnatiensis TaxID=28085 RepID=A0A378INS1_9GAMM|nr:hypothetical protein [Legionella cincinnatiensis]KTC93409.1 hypothetical protein Lcin_0447 [Legionella cincinnatiensis]STX36590.1 Uncharacterised protein [Legionella cincinnatiensis]
MGFQKYKENFKQFFLAHIEAHLQSPLDTSPTAKQNQPYNVIERSKSKTAGEFSRILDEFKIPLPTYENFKKYVQEPNSIGTYMQSLLEGILPEILNEDKTALNQKLIDAINHQNKENYKKMVEKTHNNPQLIAKLFIQAIVIGYSQQMLDSLSENDKLAWFDKEAVEFTFIANYVSIDGLSESVQKPITLDQEQLILSIDSLKNIYTESNSITDGLERAQLFLAINPLKSLEAYLRAIELALEDENFNKLSDEQVQLLYKILKEDIFLSKYGQLLENRLEYFKSYIELGNTNPKNPEVNQAVKNLLSTVKKLKENGEISMSDLPRITKYLKDTTTLINNPDSLDACNQHNSNIQDALGTNRRWGPIVGGALLCIAGVLLVAAAIAITVLTFGASSPLTLPTAAVGGAMTAAGIAMTVGVAVGLAATAGIGVGVASKAGIFVHKAVKGPIASAMEEVSSSIEKAPSMTSV